MFVKNNNIIVPIVLFFLSFTSYIWGNGSCRFDRETGYIDSSLYVKGNESFLIVHGGDSRYGTISTVYNALTCKEIASGDSAKSNFSGLMERKGFTKIDLNSRHLIDKSFQNKITFLENSDDIIVHVEPIESSVREELNTLIASLSDKSASSQINISNSAKEFLGYRQFSTLLLAKLNSLPISDINYDYALSLTNKLTLGDMREDSKRVILAKQKEVRERLAKIEEEKKKRAIAYHKERIKENLKIFAKNYGIDKYMKKDAISWTPNRKWDYRSNDHTITGRGTIWFNPDDSTLDDVYIKGNFRNNKLISKANLKIDASICLLDGIFSCRKGRSASDNKMVTSQNLATSISSLSSSVRDKVYQKAYGGYNQKKSVGERVCMSGNSLFWKTDITAYVESVSGDRIQLRISDTEGQNPNYHGTTLRQGTIIWDDYNNWEPCY